MLGKTIGNFKITREIGIGGMGKVFAGTDLMLEREVAIKVLRPELLHDANIVARFHAEAMTLAKLSHPNIATVYAFLRDGEDYFLIMEFIRGWTLREIIEAHSPLPSATAIALFHQVLEGIGFAHKQGIIHRDIKPSNFILMENGLLKVMDFGIARILGSARLTRTGHLLGTPEYMAPEQIRGEATDSRSDIYSLGILLYELLTGQAPFCSDSDFKLMKAQVETAPPSPRDLRPDLPRGLEQVILRALAKDPEQRFQTTDEFAGAIETHLGDIDSQTESLQALLRLLKEESQANLGTEPQRTGLAPTMDESLGEWPKAAQETQVITGWEPQATRFAPTVKETLRALNAVKATRPAKDFDHSSFPASLRPSRRKLYLGLSVVTVILLASISLHLILKMSSRPVGTVEPTAPIPPSAEVTKTPSPSQPLSPANGITPTVAPSALPPQAPAEVPPDTAVRAPESQPPSSAEPTTATRALTRVQPDSPPLPAAEPPAMPETPPPATLSDTAPPPPQLPAEPSSEPGFTQEPPAVQQPVPAAEPPAMPETPPPATLSDTAPPPPQLPAEPSVAPLITPPSPTTSKIAPDKQDVKAPQKAPKSKKRLVKKEPKVELEPKSQKGATEKDSNWFKRLLKRDSPGNSGWNDK